MRKALGICALVLAGCGSDDQLIDVGPAPEVPTTTAGINTTTTLPDVTTTEAPTTTTTTIDWGPVLCEWLDHPYHHDPCPVNPRATTATTTGEYLREQTTTAPERSASSGLASIRACESHGDYTTDTGNGYYGAYQFAWSTWASVGGTGNPAHASPAEQDMRAQMMIDAGRRGEWPNC